MSTPAIYPVSITHARREQVRHSFRYSHYLWLVDLDRLPRLPRVLRWLARFRSQDHLGDPRARLRDQVDLYLAQHGVDLTGGRALMLTNPAVAGYTFNPLTVIWCLGYDGTPVCTIAEVHNTYGSRHRYLLFPDSHGRTGTHKDFYVSPFFPVDGRYELSLPIPDARLQATIRYYRQDGDGHERLAFAAAMTGRRRPATAVELLRQLLRHPFPTARVALLIRWQGLRLWARGLRPHPSR